VRILYFTRSYTPHDHRFLNTLSQTGHQVFYLPLEEAGSTMEDRPLPPGIEQIPWHGAGTRFRWRDSLRLAASLRPILRRIKPDLIHAGPLQNAAFVAALSGFQPLVSMSWGSDLLIDADRSIWMRIATRYTLKHTRILLGDCRAVRDKAVQQFAFPPEQVVLFPWGIDLEQFSPRPAHDPSPRLPGRRDADIRRRLGWEDAFVLLSLRSWEPIYGVDVILRAFTHAVRQIPELRLLLLGDGSLAPKIRSYITQEGLSDYISIEGRVSYPNLPSYYHAADLYLSASHSDGSSVSLMEALGCGVPCAVSDIPGNCEWIEPGVQGWLFPDGDDPALAEAILCAWQERHQLETMRRAARALAEERADWRKNFPKLLAAYQTAVRRKPSA